MTNRARELIKSFYEEEALRKDSEVSFADYSVRLNSSDIAMLEIIAKRFGKGADRLAAEAVSSAVYSMVEALETTERKQMAKEADELNESLSKKAAKSNGRPEFDEKSITWVMNDRAITREENKRKKELEDTQSVKAAEEPKIEAKTESEVPAQTSDDQSQLQTQSEASPAESVPVSELN